MILALLATNSLTYYATLNFASDTKYGIPQAVINQWQDYHLEGLEDRYEFYMNDTYLGDLYTEVILEADKFSWDGDYDPGILVMFDDNKEHLLETVYDLFSALSLISRNRLTPKLPEFNSYEFSYQNTTYDLTMAYEKEMGYFQYNSTTGLLHQLIYLDNYSHSNYLIKSI